MKKKLKYFIPLWLVLLILLVPLLAALRSQISWGESQMELFCIRPTGARLSLVQVRENGIRQRSLGISLGNPVFSPNGRYAAVSTRKNDRSDAITRLYDLEAPQKPRFTIDGNHAQALVTDEGLLLYHQSGGLYCHDGTGELLLDAQALPSLQLLENTVYYFRKADGEAYDLYACDLPDGTPRLIGEDLSHTSLQTSLHEGKHYIIAARQTFYEGSLYDQVIDDAGEEKAELREALKAKRSGETLTSVYRFVDGEQTLLAEGLRGSYLAEPVSGTVVGQFSAFLKPQYRLSELKNDKLAEPSIWYCIQGSESAELTRQKAIDPVITPAGEVYLVDNNKLLRMASPRSELEVLHEDANNFRVLLDGRGGQELYILTRNRELLCLKDGEAGQITDFSGCTYFPAIPLPGGALLKTADCFFFKRIAAASLRAPGPVTMVLYGYPSQSDLYYTLYRVQNGETSPVAELRGMDNVMAMTRAGQIIADADRGWYLLRENSAEQLLPLHSTIIFSSALQLVELDWRSKPSADALTIEPSF